MTLTMAIFGFVFIAFITIVTSASKGEGGSSTYELEPSRVLQNFWSFSLEAVLHSDILAPKKYPTGVS
jgi:hypothetical protein